MKRQFAVLLVLSPTLFSSGCVVLDDEHSRVYKSGLQARDGECWDQAIGFFHQLREEKPEFGPAWLEVAICKHKIGLVEESTIDLQNFLAKTSPDRRDRATAHYYLARNHIERAREWSVSKIENAQVLFAVALDTLELAWELGSMNYDTALWLAYASLQVERRTDALDALHTCQELDPDRQEHQLLLAVAEDEIHHPGYNLATYLDLAKADSPRSLGLLYDHLASIHDDLAEDSRVSVINLLQSYRESNFVVPPQISSLLTRVEAEEEAKRLRKTLETFRSRISSFEANNQYAEALRLVEEFREDLSESIDLDDLRSDIRNRWALDLESKANKLIFSSSAKELTECLRTFRKALELSTDTLRRIVLEQKIDALQVSLNRVPPRKPLVKAQSLLKNSQYESAIEELQTVPPESLSPTEREPYFYLLGVSNYNAGRWGEAVKALEKVQTETFWDLHQMRGISYWRTARRKAALKDLSLVSLETRSDEALQIMGHQELARLDYPEAVRNLERISNASPHDLDALQRALTLRGIALGEEGKWSEAVETLRSARKVIESRLNRHRPRVYLELGRAYWNVEDFDRAERTLRDLLDMDLSPEELSELREAFLLRARLSHRRRSFSSTHEDLQTFLQLGGKIPDYWRNQYDRVIGVFSEFSPLAEGNRWDYRSVEDGKTITVEILRREIDGFVVEINVDGEVKEEKWYVASNFLHRVSETKQEIIPVRLSSPDGPYPSLKFLSRATLVESRILEIGMTVTLRDDKTYENCLRVQTGSESRAGERIVRYFAPRVGEIRREIHDGSTLVRTFDLEHFQAALP